MEAQTPDDKLIVRYLLGELSEEEQTQLEEHAFSDPDYLQHVRAVEKDLIDEYARGELSGTARAAFERRFLASERRRRQIEFARAFAKVVAEGSATESSEVAPAATASWWNSFKFFRRGPNLAFRFSLAAAALIIVIGGLLLLRQSMQSRIEQAQTQPPPQATPQSQSRATPQSTTDQNAQNGVPTPPPQNKRAPSTTPQPQVIASLLLLPATSRSAENLPQLTIQPGTASAQLRIRIDNAEPYNHFRAELHTTAGKAIASQGNLKVRSTRVGRMIVWLIPASLLDTGEYELSLSGLTQQEQAEAVGYYYFKVLKQ